MDLSLRINTILAGIHTNFIRSLIHAVSKKLILSQAFLRKDGLVIVTPKGYCLKCFLCMNEFLLTAVPHAQYVLLYPLDR